MDKFLLISSVQDLKTSTERDFIYEYVTTAIPFEIQTTPEVPESYTSNIIGLYVLYGMGGILIFLVVYTIFYGCCMPNMSDEALRRDETRYRQYLNERIRNERIERANLREVSSPNTISREVVRSSRVIEQTPASNDSQPAIRQQMRRLGETPSFFSSSPQGEERFSVRRIREIIRSSTTPKQSMENRPINSRVHENRNPTIHEYSSFTPQLCDASVQVEMNQQLHTDVVTKQDSQYFADTESTFDNSSAELAESLNVPSTSQQGKSRSSPTSPDIVRRRYPSIESTPRRPSSWR